MTPDITDGGNVSQTKITEEQTPNDPSAKLNSTLLREAINSAPLGVLQQLLLDIVDKNDEARAQASTYLLVPSEVSGAKRKAYETCINCNKDYNVSDNAEDACMYHDGKPDVDYSDDFWADHPDGCGEPEDLVDEPDYVGGFAWTCCGPKYETAGCIKTRHRSEVATEKLKKKNKMDVASMMD